jgi:hypothetical protein
MESITLKLTKEQSALVQELLEKALEKQRVIGSNAGNKEIEIKRAQFVAKCIELLLQSLQQGYTAVEMPAELMKPALAQLKIKLENYMAIMLDLMQDESLKQDNLVQVFTRGIELLNVMHRMTYEALQVEEEAA